MTQQEGPEEDPNRYARLSNKELALLFWNRHVIGSLIDQFPKADRTEDGERFISVNLKERATPGIGKLSSVTISPARHIPVVIAGRRISRWGFIMIIAAVIGLALVIRVATS